MERIRIALMEKRVMLGDIFARFEVVIGGGGLEEMLLTREIARSPGARLRLFFNLLGAAPLHRLVNLRTLT